MSEELADLAARLASAERQLESARMIDSWARCQSETAYWQGVVDGLKRQIEEIERR